jgi:predicted nucleic acid-binding protein
MPGKAFWDTSALLTLFVSQAASTRARAVSRKLPHLVVWWGSTVEVRSAVARLAREGALTPKGAAQTLVRLTALRARWDEVEPSEPVRRLAEELPESRALRAGDAFQLAAALVWCKERPNRRPFVSFDNALADAAEAEGFEVYRITAR